MNSQPQTKIVSIVLLTFLLFAGISPLFLFLANYPEDLIHSLQNDDIRQPIALITKSETLGHVSGDGLNRITIIQTNISDLQNERTEITDISVQTNSWNISYTNLSFMNLQAKDIWKTYEETYNYLTNYTHIQNETWAAPLILYKSCYLDTIAIINNAINYSLSFGLSQDENVNITVNVWNSTSGSTPHEIISSVTWINKLYTFQSLVPFPTPTWDNFNLTEQSSSPLLDITKTLNNQFFVSINCSGTVFQTDATSLGWYYDNSGGNAYNWTGSWDLKNQNMTLRVYLKPLNTSPTPSEVDLKVNSYSATDVGPGSGYWINNSLIIAQGQNTIFDISSNWSIAFDATINCVLQNITQLPSTFIGGGSNDLVNWNVTIGLEIIPNRASNYTINVTVPFNWNQTPPKAFRFSNPSISAPVFEDPNGITSSFILNADDGGWVLYCNGLNYLELITIEKWRAGTFLSPSTLNTTVNITDLIRINGTLKTTVTGNANLSVYSPCYVLNYSDSQAINNQIVSFTPFTVDSFTNMSGSYSIQITWGNGEQVGIRNITLDVVYPTTLTIHSPKTESFILNTPINVTVEYTNAFNFNKFNETGILDARVTCTFGNSTKNDTFNLNEIGNGNYYVSIDTNSYAIGYYSCNITAGSLERNNISAPLSIELVYDTSIASNVDYVELYYEFNVTLKVNYSAINPAFGISGASVKSYIDGKYYADLNELGAGNYSLQLNTSLGIFRLYPGIHTVKINATRQNYIVSQIFITVVVNATPTELRLHSNATVQGGQRVNLTVTYNTTSLLQGKYLLNSTLRCLLDGVELTEVSNPSQLDNGRFFVSNLNNGTYNLELLIDIGENRTLNEGDPFDITIIATQPGYSEKNVTGIINLWVWNTTMIITSWDASATYGENITINLLYFNTTSNFINGVVTCDYPDNSVIRNSQGNYTITFNTTGHHAGDWIVAINITLTGHEWNLTLLFIHVYGTPTLIAPYPIVSQSIKVNQTLQDIVVTYNQTNGLPIPFANVEITLSNSTYTFSNNTGALKIYYTYLNGICTVDLIPGGLHQGNYNLTISIENHTDTHAFEQNNSVVLLTILPLESYLLPSREGDWWLENSLLWYENESLLLKLHFNATFYDLGPLYNDSLTWGAVSFNLYAEGNPIPYKTGLFISLSNGTYLLNLTLDMPISATSSNYYENYVIELTGTAMDCISSHLNVSIQYYAKNLVTISLVLPSDVIEGETVKISARLRDSFGGAIQNERIIFTLIIEYKSSITQTLYLYALTDSSGIASINFELPYNTKSFKISIQSEQSVSSLESNNVSGSLKIHTSWYLPLRFLKRTWYIFLMVIIATLSTYYYVKKYKPKIVKMEEKRETLNYKYVSAVNLMHLLVYETKSRELLYAYSSPGLKLTSYLMNSILQSMSMYVDMSVEFQEVYLQDDICLTLTDGTILRVAVISKNLPSIEMQKQIAAFIDLFEEAFKDKIPEAMENIVAVSRIINLEFANQLIERCFEKSLTFPHIAQRPADNQPLTEEENRVHKIAYNVMEKSGPFLLGRLLAKSQMESGISELPKLVEIVFKLREKEALKPIPPKEADRVKDEMMRKKIKDLNK